MENADKNVIFAQRLNIELDKLKITQGEFCKKVDISTGALFNYKTGKRLPDIDNLIKLAEEFNCSTDYLLNRTDNPTMPKNLDNNHKTDILYKYNSLSDENKQHLICFLDYLYNK